MEEHLSPSKEMGNQIRYIITVEIDYLNLNEAMIILNKLRRSVLIFGSLPNDELFWNELIQKSEDFDGLTPQSWISIVTQFIEKDLVLVRFFGSFDDIESGVLVYEPTSFAENFGDWKDRLLV